jgi:hypothetical protein
MLGRFGPQLQVLSRMEVMNAFGLTRRPWQWRTYRVLVRHDVCTYSPRFRLPSRLPGARSAADFME